MAEVDEAPASFFDFFSADLFENVLKCFSLLPNSKSWETHVRLGDVSRLLPLQGEFGSFTKSRFDTLRVSERKFSPQILPHGAHLWTHSLYVARKYILAGGGQSLKKLVVDTPDISVGSEYILEDFVNHCPNVTSLSITLGGIYWARKFGQQIEKLQVRVDYPLHSPWNFPDLRELHMTMKTDHICPGFWKYIGRSLEKLVVSFHVNSVDNVGDIGEHCRKLKVISLGEGYYRAISATVSLLASYGDQLEHALLSMMNEKQILEVIEACPNARFDLHDFFWPFSSAGIDLIGPKLDCIVGFKFTVADGDDPTRQHVWDKCNKIRKLEVSNGEFECMQKFFSKPKAVLKDLRFDFDRNASEENWHNVMKVCAEETNCIEHFTFWGPLFYGDASRKFLMANRASLKSISMGPYNYGAGEKLNELLDSFLALPALEELYINCTIPSDKLKTLFERGIYWKRNARDSDVVYPLLDQN